MFVRNKQALSLLAIVVLGLSLLLFIPVFSGFSPAKLSTRRKSWMLNRTFYDADRLASGGTTSLWSTGQVDDKGGHGQQVNDLGELRERQRNIAFQRVVSTAESTSENVTKRLRRRHHGQKQQQRQQFQQYHHQQQQLIYAQQQIQQLPPMATHDGTRQQRDIASSSLSFCSLLPKNPDLPRLLRTLSQKGETHLIEYSITFPEYSTNPLKADWTTTSRPNATSTYVYQETKWQRVLSNQGKTLLTLAFNYDVLSLGLLGYGVKSMTVPLLDSPPNCLAAQNNSQRMALTLSLLLRDFDEDRGSGADGNYDGRADTENDIWRDASNVVCHQIVQDSGGFAKFSHECCTSRHYSGKRRIACDISSPDNLVTFLNILLASLAVLFFFFGPLLLQKLLFSGSTGRQEYVVPLEPHLRKTILIRRVPCEDGSSPAKRKEIRQFVRFRELVKGLKSEQVMRVTFKRLDILVDNRELMSEDEVPVGLFRFLLDAFVRCKIIGVEPFRTCCAESVIGSWSPFFLWFRLKRHASDCNRGCKEICAWSSIFRCLGGLLLMVTLLLPYYVRLAAFYWFEKEEMEARNEARTRLGLPYTPGGFDLFQWLTPGHSLVVSIHVAFYVSYLFLFIIRAADASRVDDVILRNVTDMRKLRRKECLRMLCAHLVLPFEKFGLCGVPVAALYLPLALPFCLLVALIYCIPTLYLVGRLLVPSRPKCLRTRPFPSPPAEELNPTNGNSLLLSEGATSFSSCFLLDRISVDRSLSVKGSIATTRDPCHQSKSRCPSRQSVAKAIASAFIAMCMTVCMLTILAMYAETFGFFVEVGIFATLGAIVNAKYSICNVIFVFWSCVYVVVPYRAVYARYTDLSRCIFRFLKTALADRIQSASLLRHEKQKNTAFKFLDAPEAGCRSSTNPPQNPFQPKAAGSSCEQDTPAKTTERVVIRTPADQTSATITDTDETIEYRDDRLHWKIRSLVLFVDRKDKPRIPRQLFWRICELDLTGSPGPVRRAMAVATGQVLASLLFLLLLYVVVRLSTEMQPTSTVLQALVVFSVGSAPVVIAFVARRQSKQRLNEYSLTGNIRQTILDHYEHAWPVQDLRITHFKDLEDAKDPDDHRLPESCPKETRDQRSDLRGRASYDPSQVDLLITIREEDEARHGDEGPCSPTPPGSPDSDVFRNIDDDFIREELPLGLLVNRAMRCTSDPTAESHHPYALVPGLSCHDVAVPRDGVNRENTA